VKQRISGTVVKFGWKPPERSRRPASSRFVFPGATMHYCRNAACASGTRFSPLQRTAHPGGKVDRRAIGSRFRSSHALAGFRHGQGQEFELGLALCGATRNCGVGTALMVNNETNEMGPLSALPLCGGITYVTRLQTRLAARIPFLALHVVHSLLRTITRSRGRGDQLYDSSEVRSAGVCEEVRTNMPSLPERTYEERLKRRQSDP